MIERALKDRVPGPHRPALNDRERGNVVAVGGIAVIILAGRGLGHTREDLERDTAGPQARQIGMTAIIPARRVAHPQKHVGVQIGDPQRCMKGFGLLADRIGLVRGDAVHPGINPGRQDHEDEADDPDNDQRDDTQ